MYQKIQMKLQYLTPAQLIVSFYFIAVSVSVLLLSLPIAHQKAVEWDFIDALFTAVSAVSVTGLTVINIADTFSVTGVFILAFVLQFGGIGVMTLGTFIWLIMGKKIGLKERKLIMLDQNQTNLSGLVNLMKQILVIIFIIELIGALLLGTYFLNYYSDWKVAYLQGFFASVSATTNGGFDITGNSLIPYAQDYFVQTVNMILIVLGAIGFPVLIEVKDFLTNRKRDGYRFRFSLFSKLTSATFFLLVVFGTVIILLLEIKNFFIDKVWHEALFYSLFQSVSTRSGGLSTMNINEFSEPTLLFLSILMFIGASPSSVGGGIRTTTFALNILFIYHFSRGNSQIKVFGRELYEDDLFKSLAVTIIASILCFTSILILTITEPFSLISIVFEVCSAFGTSGLSMGITPDLSTIGKLIIIFLMFVGRIGIIVVIFLIGGQKKKAPYHFPKERVIIG